MTFPAFDEFFHACTHHHPLRWQRRLAALAVSGRWPDLVELPTGSGKTAVLLIAVYAAAYQAHSGGARTTPQRIIHVVDRRPVVDQTAAAVLESVSHIGPGPVTDALAKLAGPWADTAGSGADGIGDAVVEGIHGAAPDSRQWQRATGITVVSLTPHQLVSRLLFRGYGVAARSRSIHAGLLGVDSLLVFDEPHLSAQAIETTRRILRMQAEAGPIPGIPASRMVLLGATIQPGRGGADESMTRFKLETEDLNDTTTAELLARPRPLILKAGPTADASVAAAIVGEFRRQHGLGTDRRIAVVVNTVAMAQAVFQRISATGCDPVLMTSRLRGLERQEAARTATSGHPGLVVVGTQSLEVGLDLTFDALITEACPYPSLVQRLGRLNRDGSAKAPEGVIVIGKRTGDRYAIRKATAAVYGVDCVAATNSLLELLAVDGAVDMSAAAQATYRERAARGGDDALYDDCWPEPARIATFHPGYLPVMTSTYPTPRSDLPVGSFISGPDARDLDVLVAWRNDLDILDACSVDPLEQVSVPLWALREFLAGASSTDVSDLDIPIGTGTPTPWAGSVDDIRVRRDDAWDKPDFIADLRPGDQVVLSCAVGGYHPRLGWTGAARAVPDISMVAALGTTARRPRAFPLTKETVTAWTQANGIADQPAPLIQAVKAVTEQRDDIDSAEIRRVLADASPEVLDFTHWDFSFDHDILIATRRNSQGAQRRATAVGLSDHGRDVAAVARAACAASGLRDPRLAAIVTMAAWHHDDGKADAAFQRYLGNRQPLPSDDQILAKSGRARSAAYDRRIAAAVGYSTGWRHEGLSALRAREAGRDPLTVHLIGSHHGRFHPFLFSSAVGDGQDELPSRAEEFASLNAQWGPWGLAYLEVLVRLSDWRASALEEAGVPIPLPGEGTRELDDETAVVATPRFTSTGPSVSRSRSDEARDVELTGLASTPLAGWFAAAGLLRAVFEEDPRAAVCWPQTGEYSPAFAVWRSTVPLGEACRLVLESPQWTEGLEALSRQLDGGFTRKHQKVAEVGSLPELLDKAATDGRWLVLGLVQDAHAASAGSVPLAIPALANNSSYVEVAVRARNTLTADQLETAFTDPTAGWETTQCDGGFDRPGDDDGVTGKEIANNRRTRAALAPAALFGMAGMGAVGTDGLGVSRRTLELPLPSTFMTLAELAAHTHAVARWTGWYLSYEQQKPTTYSAFWAGHAAKR